MHEHHSLLARLVAERARAGAGVTQQPDVAEPRPHGASLDACARFRRGAEPTTPAIVAAAKKAFATCRTMRRNRRLGLYQGRNGGGDGAEASEDYAGHILRRLRGTDAWRLEGMLWAEHKLAERISENRDAGHDRPELRARIKTDRDAIRATLKALA